LYWTLANSGVTATSYVPTFTYNAGDIIGGADQSKFIVGKYTPSAWSSPTGVLNSGSNPYSTSISGINTYGDFVVGETACTTATPPTTATLSPASSNVCAGTTLTLTGAASGGTDAGCTIIEYQYSTDGTNWSTASTSIPSFSAVTGTNTIQARRNSCATGCTSSTAWNTVATWTVVAQPVADNITPNVAAGNVCAGQSLSATFAGASGGAGTIADVHEFSINNGGSYSAYTGAISTASLVGQTVIIRTSRTANGTGCSTSAYKTVSWTVQSITTTPAITGSYCAGGTSISGTSESDASIIVYAGSTPIGSGLASGTSWMVTVSPAFVASDVITATATAAGKCISAASTSITLNTLPLAPTGSSSQSLCTGAKVSDLSATGTGIQWYSVSSGGTALSGTTTLATATHYYASQTNANGCESSARLDVTVTIKTRPTAHITSSSASICTSGSGNTLMGHGSLLSKMRKVP